MVCVGPGFMHLSVPGLCICLPDTTFFAWYARTTPRAKQPQGFLALLGCNPVTSRPAVTQNLSHPYAPIYMGAAASCELSSSKGCSDINSSLLICLARAAHRLTAVMTPCCIDKAQCVRALDVCLAMTLGVLGWCATCPRARCLARSPSALTSQTLSARTSGETSKYDKESPVSQT